MSVDERLEQFLKEAKDWEKRATSIPGLFLLKLPGLKGSPPSISIEINPVDASGSPTKKRGVAIRSATELKWIKDILSLIPRRKNVFRQPVQTYLKSKDSLLTSQKTERCLH